MTLTELRERAVLSPREAFDVLGISPPLGYALLRRGEIPSLRFGRKVIVPGPALLRMLGDRPDEAEAEPAAS